MRNALAAYAILIPMVIATIFVSAQGKTNASMSLQSVQAYFLMVTGTINLESDRYQSALDDYNKAIELEPNQESFYNQRACAYQGLKKDREAIADCQKALSMEADGNTYATRGFSYGRLGDFKAQIRDYDAAIEIQPDTGVLYAYRARAYEKAGNLEAAARDNAKAKSLGLHAGHFDQEQLKE